MRFLVLRFLAALFAAAVLARLGWFGALNRLMPSLLSLEFWVVLLVAQLIEIGIHESGHLLAAWAVGFDVEIIAIGPLWIRWRSGRVEFRFHPEKMFFSGGYVGGLRLEGGSLRARMACMLLAGPGATFAAGGLMLLLFLDLSGTGWERVWHGWGPVPLAFFAGAMVNLIPLGRLDGGQLLALLFPQDGDDLVARYRGFRSQLDAQESSAQGDAAVEIEHLCAAIPPLLRHPSQNAAHLARAYWNLGQAQLNAGRWKDAGASLREGLEFAGRCGIEAPAETFLCWSALHSLHCRLQRWTAAEEAYQAALAASVQAGNLWRTPAQAAAFRGRMAALFVTAQQFELALEETNMALAAADARLSKGEERTEEDASLLLLRAQCEFCLGDSNSGLRDVGQAERILRRAAASASDPRKALGHLASLGRLLWNVGRDEPAVQLLHKVAMSFEDTGSAGRAASLRVALAMAHYCRGCLDEAARALPSADRLEPSQQRLLLDFRASIHLRSELTNEAVAELEEALRMALEDPQETEAHVAMAESHLARAYLQAGRVEEADSLSQHSRNVLRDAGHPAAAGALVTLALIAWKRADPSAKATLGEAVKLMVAARLVDPGLKARFFEETAWWLDHAGRGAEAAELRSAAGETWAALGAR